MWLFASGTALAANGGTRAVNQQIQASLRITGSVGIDATGAVARHAIDRPDKFDPGVVAMIEDALSHWRFEPVLVNGQPHAVNADMNLLLVGDFIDGGQMRVAIKRAQFLRSDLPATDRLTLRKRGALTYPVEAVSAGVSGIVFVAVRIDHEGRVIDAVAQQVNLRHLDGEREMAKWREVLARPTVSRARTWTFRTPTTGPDVPYFTAIIPVDYSLGDPSTRAYGKWQTYVPGPRTQVAWMEAWDTAGAEALADGQLAQLGAGLRLLTPLDES
jgi:hypothetical protein